MLDWHPNHRLSDFPEDKNSNYLRSYFLEADGLSSYDVLGYITTWDYPEAHSPLGDTGHDATLAKHSVIIIIAFYSICSGKYLITKLYGWNKK